MIWRKGKRPNVAYQIGFENDVRNGYIISRDFQGYRVYFTGRHRGRVVLRDTSVQLVRQACEDDALYMRQYTADASPVLPAVHGGSQQEADAGVSA